MAGSHDTTLQDKLSYLDKTHSHVFENIKLSDQKAATFIALNSGMIAGLYGAKMLIVEQARLASTIVSSLTFALLSTAIFLAVIAIRPRGKMLSAKVLGGELAIPWKIADRSQEELRVGILASDGEGLIRESCALLHSRARVNSRKDFYVRNAVWVSVCAWFTTIVLLLMATI